jgi:two-component system sensor histidine kinase/response regulator
MMEVSSFLGTPLVSKGRSLGVLAVDNRVSGRDVRPGDGPLLYTVGSLIAAAIENSRLYAEVEAQKDALEQRVVERTAALASAIEEAQAERQSRTANAADVGRRLLAPDPAAAGRADLSERPGRRRQA